MPIRGLLAVLLLASSSNALAQSADQQVVSVVDTPATVVPGNDVTYVVTMTNHGPDPATNGGLNANIDNNLTRVTLTPPPGFQCFELGNNISCVAPSFAAGATVQFTLVYRVAASLNNFPDGTLSSTFFTSGVTPDPMTGNNSETEVTAYDSPQVDMTISATDMPDPVFPEGDITFAVRVRNDGPDVASAVNVNFVKPQTAFRSITAPSGWSCPSAPPIGSTASLTCSRASVPVGTYDFTLVVRASNLGGNDGTITTTFGTGANGSHETDQSDNNITLDTAYQTPDANLSVAVVDTPDPQFVEDAVDFTVTVGNSGPDAATTTRLNVVGDGGLQFVSVAAPAGFSCGSPAVGATPNFTCTASSFAKDATAEFTVRLRSDEDVLGEDGGTVMTLFGVNSDVVDPSTANNNETETTTIAPFRLFRDGFEG